MDNNNAIHKKVEEIVKLINLIPGNKLIALNYTTQVTHWRPDQKDKIKLETSAADAAVSSEGVLTFQYLSPLSNSIYILHRGENKFNNFANMNVEWDTYKDILTRAITTNGVMVIRQFLDIKVERFVDEQKKLWIPQKKIYGMMLGRGSWMPLSKERAEEASIIEGVKLSKYLDNKSDVMYSDLSEFINKLLSENNNVKER